LADGDEVVFAEFKGTLQAGKDITFYLAYIAE